jgi:hypothetical protein
MSENIQRSRGKPQNYKFDRGGMSAEMGPYIGVVVNNVDNTRSGRLQVYIAEFGATAPNGKPNLTDPSLWRTVSYCPPFYGSTPQLGTSTGSGTYPGNPNSYGMWFTPPDLGVKVICFFVAGDPSQGYYLGCVPEQSMNHMIPAIGSSSKFTFANAAQQRLLAGSNLLPVTEINGLNPNVSANPRFWEQAKPIQSQVARILYQQGLINDPVRGSIRSNSQRESPSSVYGISTPGKPIYQSGIDPKVLKSKLDAGLTVSNQDVAVIGRQGGHTFVMDDGDVGGTDALIRIRTAKGHQITMSDDGDCFYITHANGQTWIELGKQGTVDIFSTNSVNVRTQGVLNLHADKGINMYSGGPIRMKSKSSVAFEATTSMSMIGQQKLTMYSKGSLGLKTDSRMAFESKVGSWNAGSSLTLKAGVINLNGGSTIPVVTPNVQTGFQLPDTVLTASQGWVSRPKLLTTIVTRAPTHEPYAYHNQGVSAITDLDTTEATGNATSAVRSATSTVNSLATKAVTLAEKVSTTVINNPISDANFLAELPALTSIPVLFV